MYCRHKLLTDRNGQRLRQVYSVREGLEFQAEPGVDQDGGLRQLQQQWSQQHRIGCDGSTPSYNHPLYVLLQSYPHWVAGGTRRASQPRTLGTRRKVTKTAQSLFTIRP
ncbi:hypothetical protein B0J15DRAFT_267213 [Fusarium solani]|uniref:Uncharacterized protein n=1 Tax=Fusarium solani TaxID=169388 RepID=A0A9P9HWK9_FUSSL|nr:uncharacterized protein B0J15DRAFT_267213 [Fusarium solani]KAH7264262.1 hypothetical protein B0J15DRAFT_267213 [Fusarium solani]